MEGLRVSKLEEGQQWGKNTSSRDKVEWGRRPPYIVGGTIQPLPPKTAPQRAVLPQRATVLPLGPAVLPLPLAVLPLGPERYYRGGRAVLPHTSGTTAPTAAASTVKPDTKKDPSNRGGTSARPQRYYGWGLPAVLPL